MGGQCRQPLTTWKTSAGQNSTEAALEETYVFLQSLETRTANPGITILCNQIAIQPGSSSNSETVSLYNRKRSGLPCQVELWKHEGGKKWEPEQAHLPVPICSCCCNHRLLWRLNQAYGMALNNTSLPSIYTYSIPEYGALRQPSGTISIFIQKCFSP